MRFPVHRPFHRFSLSLLLTVGVIAWDQQSHSVWWQAPQSPHLMPLMTQAISPFSGVQASTRLTLAQLTSANQALLDAVAAGHLGEVRAALEQGASPDAGDAYSGYALSSAATLGYTEIVQLLLDRGANVDIASGEGYRPLIEAIAANQIPSVQILLERKADPNRMTAGLTPLEFAIQDSNVAAVKLLLQAGATVKPADGRDLLAKARQQGNAEIIALIQQAQR